MVNRKDIFTMSYATGTFAFPIQFYKKHRTLIENYFANTHFGQEYGIDQVKSNYNGFFNFKCHTHSNMQVCLQWVLAPAGTTTLNLQYLQFMKLKKFMQDEHIVVEFNYKDHDPDEKWTFIVCATIKPTGLSSRENLFAVDTIFSYNEADLHNLALKYVNL